MHSIVAASVAKESSPFQLHRNLNLIRKRTNPGNDNMNSSDDITNSREYGGINYNGRSNSLLALRASIIEDSEFSFFFFYKIYSLNCLQINYLNKLYHLKLLFPFKRVQIGLLV